MEVVNADIQKRLEKPYILVFRQTKVETSIKVELISDVLRDRQRSELSGMIEWGMKSSGLLEIRRAWFIKYNKPIYFQPKEFREILKRARGIIIPKQRVPTNLEDIMNLLSRHQIEKPVIVNTCDHCLREDRITVLNKRNTAKVSATEVSCISCARQDLRIDMKGVGIDLSRAMIQQLEKQLAQVKSVPRIVEMLLPGFDPSRAEDLTLYDRVAAKPSKAGRKIADLSIPQKMRKILEKDGLETLLPIQEMVIEAGLLEGRNLLVVASTSSGKTLIGELAGIPTALSGGKMLYLSPLVALTNEKYELFRKRYKKLGLRVGIRVGMSRLDVGKEARVIVDSDLVKSDVICATYEALDFIFRSGEVKQIGKIGTVIIDEIQNLADPERGPELDGLLARLRYHYPKAQIITLSATVGAPEKLAEDLKMKLVNFTGRPVPLERHLVFARSDEEKRRMIRRLVQREFRHKSSLGNRGQSIVFTFSRRRAHSLTEWLRENGVSCTVYHGGLSYSRRRRVEASYNKQRYACVVTTAALGAGVDLPASQVIFETLAMGAEWLSTAEFEQMLGRAGRLGKHDRGKVYLLVEPGRKYHGGLDRYEDEIAVELLRGEIEEVEPFADLETSAEQILASICSTGKTKLKDIGFLYLKLLSASVPPSDALKHLVKRYMIRVKEGGVYPTELGKATTLSFLSPSEGLAVRKMADKMDVLDIAISLEPFENVYLSSKLQGEINTAFKTFMPTRFFSGVFLDLTDLKSSRGASRLPKWVFERFAIWTRDFFNCGCHDYPECEHGKIRFGRWLVDQRQDGLNPTGIARRLHDDYELWAYPGDLFSWLDTLIHNLKAVQRIAAVVGKTDLGAEIQSQIKRIESPLRTVETEKPDD